MEWFFRGSRFKYNFDSPWNLASKMTLRGEKRFLPMYIQDIEFLFLNRNLNLTTDYSYFEQNYKCNNFHWDIRQQAPVLDINLPFFKRK